MTKRDRVGGWVKNGHFRHDVFMQWPLTTLVSSQMHIHNSMCSILTKYNIPSINSFVWNCLLGE